MATKRRTLPRPKPPKAYERFVDRTFAADAPHTLMNRSG